MMSAVFLLLSVGLAGAQGVTPQTLLPGALIPKFVDPLPVAGDISVVDATGATAPQGSPTYFPYTITMSEFQANILPATAPNTPAYTGSWVWGYLIPTDVTPRPSYLGPVVLAKKGVETRPTYINALPFGGASVVQQLLPIDQTLDCADPLGTGPLFSLYGGPQPAVPHLHGGEVLPLYDGGPDAWWLPRNTIPRALNDLGPEWTVIRTFSAFAMGVFAGIATHLLRDRGFGPKEIFIEGAVPRGDLHDEDYPDERLRYNCRRRFGDRIAARTSSMFVVFLAKSGEMVWPVGKYVLAEITVGAVVERYVPYDWISRLFGDRDRLNILWITLGSIPVFLHQISASSVLYHLKGSLSGTLDGGAALAFLIELRIHVLA